MLKISNQWIDYECIDAGNGEKLENWNGIILRRPEPLATWNTDKTTELWKNHDGYYDIQKRSWNFNKKISDFWTIAYKELKFKVSPTDFKHTGLFPEQAINWDFMIEKIKKSNRKIKVLNLFAYTGGATIACSYAGASVVHVDSSKKMVEWAKENMKLSNLENNSIRFIVDDCIKFVEREIRRGNKYDAIVMDPPSYGRGPNKEVWKFENNIQDLIYLCEKLLSDKPIFFLVNAYTTGVSHLKIKEILINYLKNHEKGTITTGNIGLKITHKNHFLPCGIYGLWETDK